MYRIDLNNPQPKKKKRRLKKGIKVLLYPVFFILTFIVFFLIDYFFFSGNELFSRSSLIRAVSSGTEFVNKFVDLELKNENNITSVLIVGIDTRHVVFENGEFRSTQPKGQAGTRNTDTLIQVVYDHNKKALTMISIPRDLGVDVRLDCLKFSGSIHWVYDKTEAANCPGRGVEELKQTVEAVTGIPVQYHIFVTLDSFTEAIETVGEVDPESGEIGIFVDNPTEVWDVYPYNDRGWENVHFKKGRIFLNGEDALKYVRSRQLTSDFGRARRQQILIEAIIKRALSSETLLSTDKLSELYRIYREKTLVSELSVKEILAGPQLLENLNSGKITNIVLDPELGGSEVYLNKQPHNRPGGPYYMVPTHWKECPENEFCKIKILIASIMDNPGVFQENARLFAYATANSADKLYFDDPIFKTFVESEPPLSLIKSKNLLTTSQEIKNFNTVVVIDFSAGKYPETRTYLDSQPGFQILDGTKYKQYRLNKEDFTILVPTP